MNKTLVIVESPGKIKKIQSYLGDKYIVKASIGHIQDLDPSKISIDIFKQENGSYIFAPNYIILKDKKKVVDSLKSFVNSSKEVIIAADEDREGEFIAFSLEKQLNLKNPKRIVFNAITKDAILNALKSPKSIDINLVHAQQSRRLLDRIVGYSISPLLGSGLSAGRVQSVVVKLIIEKENEIKTELENTQSCFIGCGTFNKSGEKSFQAKMYPNINSKNLDEIKKSLINLMDVNPYQIKTVELKQVEKHPFPPFTTSTLQQEAFSRLKFSAGVTMQLAQKLYEKGYITYMRTDSCNLSKDASSLIKTFIHNEFSEKYYKYRTYKNKESSQEAHECIRMTNVDTKQIEESDSEQKLYELIWKRTIASQMAPALYDCQTITIIPQNTKIDSYFKTTNKKLAFDGFLKVYDIEEEESSFIDIKKGDLTYLTLLECKEEYDYKNCRFTEASLIKKLEQLGIGRPSTYVSILNTIQQRSYVQIANIDGIDKNVLEISIDNKKKIKEKTKKVKIGIDKKKFVPTDVGIKVNAFLEENFNYLLDYAYTAELENKLDIIANGKLNYQIVLNDLYNLLKPTVDKLISKSKLITNSNNLNIKSIGEDTDGTKYSILKSKNGWVVKKDFKNAKSSIFFGIEESQKQMSLEKAIEISKSGKFLGTHRGKDIFVMDGKFGAYLKYGTKNINLKGNDQITFDIAKKLI
jgi:DNA topoisomerase-1